MLKVVLAGVLAGIGLIALGAALLMTSYLASQAEMQARIARLEYQTQRSGILAERIAALEQAVGVTGVPDEGPPVWVLEGDPPPRSHALRLDELENRINVLERGGWRECPSPGETNCLWEWK